MLKDRVEEYKEILCTYESKLKKKKERWRYVYVDNKKTKYAISSHGCLFNTKNGSITKASHFTPEGEIIDRYKCIEIKYKGNVIKYKLHRLVAFYFCKIPKRLLEQGYTHRDLVVNHKNGIKTCNASFNLEWVTARENMQHAFDTNLCIGIFGENSHLSKITNLEALAVCRLIMDRKSNAEISEELGISEKTIQHIRHGESWKSISKNFKFPKLGNAKPYTVNESKIHEVCKLLEKHKYSDTEISNMTGIRRRYITDVRIKKRRRDISDLYNIDSEPVKQISDDAIRKACKLLSEKKLSQAKIAKECSICQCLVSEIYNRKKYIDISKDYEF